jgi:hypothetical protein
MIDELLPDTVSAVEAFADPPDAFLFPEEEAVVRNAVDKRRREFTTARVCARAALAKIGYPAAPILPGLRGSPGWPAGVVGSMTHCAGYLTIRLDGTFTATLLVPGPTVAGSGLTGFEGRWLVRDGLALTAIVLPTP